MLICVHVCYTGQTMSVASSDSGGSTTQIPVHYEGVNNRPRACSAMEKQMDQEAEVVLREWDENVQRRRQNTFHLRPKSTTAVAVTPGTANRRRKRETSHQPKSGTTSRELSTGVFQFPEINVMKKEDSVFDSSTESIEEDMHRSPYRECPRTGQRTFHMEFDVQGYDPKNIAVKISGSRLIVHAMQKETEDGRKSTTEFCRKVKLPKDVDPRKLQSSHCNGMLVVEAATISPSQMPSLSSTMSGTPTFNVSSSKQEPLNTPVVHTLPGQGKTMHLLVEVGCVFRADDVVVKLKGQDKLLINAQREESNIHGKMAATLDREFNLPEKIDAQSLKAGLTTDGLLRVTASLSKDAAHTTDTVTNGDQNGLANGNTDHTKD